MKIFLAVLIGSSSGVNKKLLEWVAEVCRVKRYSPRTAEAYAHRIGRFLRAVKHRDRRRGALIRLRRRIFAAWPCLSPASYRSSGSLALDTERLADFRLRSASDGPPAVQAPHAPVQTLHGSRDGVCHRVDTDLAKSAVCRVRRAESAANGGGFVGRE